MRLETHTPEACRKTLSRLVNLVVSGKLEPKQANAAGYLISITLQSLRVDDQERRIREIEEQLEEMENE